MRVLHRRCLEVMLFVNMPMFGAIPIPMVIPMAAPTPAIQTEVTAMAIKGERVVATILKTRVQMRTI